MARLTRVEQRARTRADVLAAARDRFLDVGYAAASLEDIADRAGYSKGAVYSNFVDKPRLCREVLEAIHEEKGREIAALTQAPGHVSERIDRFAEWVERTLGDVGWTMLELEFMVVARNDPELRAMAVELRNSLRRAVVDGLDGLVGSANPGAVRDQQIEFAADVLLSAGVGMGIHRALDPTISTDSLIASLRTTLAVMGVE